MSIEQTLSERGARYGTFTDNARIAQQIKAIFRSGTKWDELARDQQEALDMIAVKTSRLLTGDPDYVDNWHDIIGFVKLVEDRLIHNQNQE